MSKDKESRKNLDFIKLYKNIVADNKLNKTQALCLCLMLTYQNNLVCQLNISELARLLHVTPLTVKRILAYFREIAFIDTAGRTSNAIHRIQCEFSKQFYQLPQIILSQSVLSSSEVIIYGIINAFFIQQKHCLLSNNKIGTLVNLEDCTTKRYIRSLHQKKYIMRQYNQDGRSLSIQKIPDLPTDWKPSRYF